MGLTYIEGAALDYRGLRKNVTFLVDSGAGYSLLPFEIWNELELKPSREVTVVLADGTKLSRAVSECRLAIQGVQGTSPVILGEKGDEPLLGAVTLEILGLVLDPYKRTLQPMQLRL